MQDQNAQSHQISDLIGELRNIGELLGTLIQMSIPSGRPSPADDPELKAIGMLVHEGLALREIARRLGVSHTALYGWPNFMRYYTPLAAMTKAAKAPRKPRAGYRTTAGVEAYD